jgi:hypothetical protein
MRRYLLFLLLLIGAGLQSRAGRSSISGHIKTASGKMLDSVTVKLIADGGWQFKVTADDKGYFSITGLDAKTYTAVFSRRGYESRRVIEVGIDSGKAAHLALDAVLSQSPLQDARMTTVIYQKRPARAIDPGHWMAKTSVTDRARPAATTEVDRYTVAAELRAAAGKDANRSTAVKYVAPPTDPVQPGGRSTRTAEMIEAPARRRTEGFATNAAYKSADATPVNDAGEALIIPEANAGSLTSGEINDFSKWDLWADVSSKQLKEYRKVWPMRPESRVSVLVKATNGAPLANASVTLMHLNRRLWEAQTDNTGKAELWYDMFRNDSAWNGEMRLVVRAGGARESMYWPKTFDVGINTFRTSLPCRNSQKVDVAFLVDATGSMGDEISYLKAELRDILQRVADSMPLANVQTGAVFYRDRGDDYLVRSSALTDSFGLTEKFISENSAAGGGDGPEAVETALEAGLELGWRKDAAARLAFLVLDAPPHNDSVTFHKMQALIRTYAARGIRLIPVACSGSDKPTEYLLRSMALATNGTYLFLTDHSGIGESHTAPTTDKFDVEYLNGLICRVIRAFSTMPDCAPELMAAADSSHSTDVPPAGWRIYPNPTPDVLHVDHNEKTGFLYVTDISGKLVQRIAVSNSGHSSVDMRQYPAGVYSVRHSWGADKFIDGTFVVRH